MNVKELFELKGRITVITGGAGVLGNCHAEAVAEAGGIPVLLDINGDKASADAERLAQKFKTISLGLHCDITQKAEVLEVEERIAKEVGPVSVLINNATIDAKIGEAGTGLSFSRFENFSIEQWTEELSVGLTGAFLCSQVFGSQMVLNRKGVIINISSDLGVVAPDQRIYRKKNLPEEQQPVKPVTYSVIKHGIIGLTRYLATYWADKGVRANALCPGGVFMSQPPEFVEKVTQLIPLGRMASADEYKAAIVFLSGDASSYMNGAVLVMDGGRSVW